MKLYTYILKRKLATVVLVMASLAAFATLGDGSRKTSNQHRSLLSIRSFTGNFKTFSLKSGYTYRGNTILNQEKTENRYIMLNTVVTYQKGNTTYILPLKKKILLDKVNFTPEPPKRF